MPRCSQVLLILGNYQRPGLRQGKGTYDYGHGFKYEGDWKAGIKQGSGLFYVCDGSYFEGTFANGEISGSGKRTWLDGSYYEGTFDLGEMTGTGKYVSSKRGLSYEGDFLNNKFHGKGTLFCGEYEYEGEMEHHKPCGCGKATWKNGDIYEGAWRCGKRHGFGKFTDSGSDLQYEGRWAHDKTYATPSLLQFYTSEADSPNVLCEFFPVQDDVEVYLGLFAKEPGNEAARLFGEESGRRVLIRIVQNEGKESTTMIEASLRLYRGTTAVPRTLLPDSAKRNILYRCFHL